MTGIQRKTGKQKNRDGKKEKQGYKYMGCSAEPLLPNLACSGLVGSVLDAEAVFKSEEPWWKWTNNFIRRRILKTSSVKILYSRLLTFLMDAPQTLFKFQNLQMQKKICIGSWLPSESGFCPERRGSWNYSQPSSDLPFQLALKEVTSPPGSFCFPGGVLGRGALTRLPL